MGLIGDTAQNVQASQVNLNTMLLDKFDEYLAWLTRYTDLNGTNVDLQDYSDVTKETVSTPFIIASLAYLYERTSNEFYLAYLRTLIDGAIDNTDNYVDVAGIGEIFYASAFIFGGVHSADTPVMKTATCAYASTKLYAWTAETKYKNLADRVANESLNHLSVVNNSTDLAWSSGYYQSRDETNAKKGVNRQTSMAIFYAEYGKTINSTYTQYVQRIINWVWRAQIDYGGLTYNIGDGSAPQYPYTAYSLYSALESYRIDTTVYDSTLKEKIANTTSFLTNDRACHTGYLTTYFYAGAYGKAWQTTYFKDYINVTNTKAIIYACIQSLHLTEKGVKPELASTSYGFRWSQHSIHTFFNAYPLADPTYNKDIEGIGTYVVNTNTGKYQWRGYNDANPDTDADAVKDGNDGYGVQVKSSTTALKWTAGYMGVGGLTASVTNYTYYQKIRAEYSTKSVNVSAYLYPISLFIGDIEGTSKTAEVQPTNLATWRVAVENGTSWQLTSFSSGNYYKLANHILLWNNLTSPQDRASFMIKSENDTWGYRFATVPYLNVTASNHRLIYYWLRGWSNIQSACVGNQTEVFSALKSIVDTVDKTQPLSYDDMWNAYHNKISEILPEASWKTTYQASQASEPKMIGHNLPEQIKLNSWSYSKDKLIFSLTGSTGTTSNTKIYCGQKGKPKTVEGAGSWTYDSDTKVCSIIMTHASEQTVTVKWASQASGLYELNVHVKSDDRSLAGVTVDITGIGGTMLSGDIESKTTDSSGKVSWQLPYGVYAVRATIEEDVKSMTVWLNSDRDVGFSFGAQPSGDSALKWLLVPVVVLIVAFLVLPRIMRRR